MERSETIKEIATALCKFQNTVEVVLKDAENPFYKSKYASLGKVLEVIRKPMFDNGLSFVQLPEESDELITILMHTSGEWISSKYKMVPVKIPELPWGTNLIGNLTSLVVPFIVKLPVTSN